jgi:hypothetical protein
MCIVIARNCSLQRQHTNYCKVLCASYDGACIGPLLTMILLCLLCHCYTIHLNITVVSCPVSWYLQYGLIQSSMCGKELLVIVLFSDAY